VALSLVAFQQAVADVSTDDEAILRERAEARWQALIEGDFDSAYTFEAPSFREVYPLKAYRGRFGRAIAWTDAKVTKIAFEGDDTAQLRVMVEYKILDPAGQVMYGQSPLEESWIRSEDQWWHLID